MALKATIYKAKLQIADMDRGYYDDLNLTIARHPSETDERLMVRILAFALNAHEDLNFTKGLSADDEPEIWRKSRTDEIVQWIELGLPQEKRLRKACAKSEQVCLYTYGGRGADLWWEKNAGKLARFENLRVMNISESATGEMAELAQRSMDLHCSIQEGSVLLGDHERSVTIEPELLFAPH